MSVNSAIGTLERLPLKLFALVLFALCAVLFLAGFITDRSEGDIFSKRVNIAIRGIGHELLLRAGDSTSVVPAVMEMPKGVFRLRFENEFEFQPDTLVEIVKRSLVRTTLTQYTVTVYQCSNPAIVYGFEINPPLNSITPCRGRTEPRACYNIEIAFADFPSPTVLNLPTALALTSVLLIAGVVVIRSVRSKPAKPIENQIHHAPKKNNAILIGKFVFDPTHQTLTIGDELTALTDKESKILTLLNRNIGNLTLRDDLIREVWTEEGVITGRSLDMFISKLRKKLSADPDVRITNVHGKGYKLEIMPDLRSLSEAG